MKLSQDLFWDANLSTIDFEKHAQYVVERVVTRGRLDDWKQIVQFYGHDRLKKLALQIKQADRKTLNFLSIYFDEAPQNFRCFTTIQLHLQL